MERVTRRKRIHPQKDAVQYIKLKRDKPGLKAEFINSYKGRGVFATDAFCKGDFVLEYRGKVTTSEHHDANTLHLFDFQWKGKTWCLDSSIEDESLGQLVNDEKLNPNCRMKIIDIERRPHLCLFALRDIVPGEEINYNYGNCDWSWHKQEHSPPLVTVPTKENPTIEPQHENDEFSGCEHSEVHSPKLVKSSTKDNYSVVMEPKAEDNYISACKGSESNEEEYMCNISALQKQRTLILHQRALLDKQLMQIDSLLASPSLSDQCYGGTPATQNSNKRCPKTTQSRSRKRQNGQKAIFEQSDSYTDDSDVEYVASTESSPDESFLHPDTQKPQHFPAWRFLKQSTPKIPSPEKKNTIGVFPASNTQTCRVYDKRNYCLFCFKPASKIARHLETVHQNEAEVAMALQFPKNSKERRAKLSSLRNRGNFAHNAEVVRKGAGNLVPCYRPHKSREGKHFIYCLYCRGLYSKKTLWKHMKVCPDKPKDSSDAEAGRKHPRSLCAMSTPAGFGLSDGLRNVLSHMTYDNVSHAVQNDSCILQFGQHMFNRLGSDVQQHDYIRQKMRELGRLLLEAKKITPLRRMEDFVLPENFSHVVSTVKIVAGYDSQSNTFRSPSLALKLGRSLNKISAIIETNALICGDKHLADSARDFRLIHKARWNALICDGALTTLEVAKWNAPQILTFTQDVKCMHIHMEEVQNVAGRMLTMCPSSESYSDLAKVALALAITFNRRRAEEVSRMELGAFISRNKSELHKDSAVMLPDLEKKMCQIFSRVDIRGKHGQMLPVLLKPSMVTSLELLAEKREKCSIPKNNPYMFAKPGSFSHYRGEECVEKYAADCGAKHPEALTSTKFRKHIATISQIMNLDENQADQLANLLGHNVHVQRQYYRLPQGTLQLAKMSKLLLAMEKGTLSQCKGKSLDNLEIDPEEHVDGSSEEKSSSSDEDEPAKLTHTHTSHRSSTLNLTPSVSADPAPSVSTNTHFNKQDSPAHLKS